MRIRPGPSPSFLAVASVKVAPKLRVAGALVKGNVRRYRNSMAAVYPSMAPSPEPAITSLR